MTSLRAQRYCLVRQVPVLDSLDNRKPLVNFIKHGHLDGVNIVHVPFKGVSQALSELFTLKAARGLDSRAIGDSGKLIFQDLAPRPRVAKNVELQDLTPRWVRDVWNDHLRRFFSNRHESSSPHNF